MKQLKLKQWIYIIIIIVCILAAFLVRAQQKEYEEKSYKITNYNEDLNFAVRKSSMTGEIKGKGQVLGLKSYVQENKTELDDDIVQTKERDIYKFPEIDFK
jgi:DNA-binding transcriptional regulator of glucitol operon